MAIHFVTADGEGFATGSISMQADGSVMVGLGSTIEREQPMAREEQIELVVRIANAAGRTIEQIQDAAMQRAEVIIAAAAEALASARSESERPS
jgi:flagellar basal body P-ring protein FlgI